MKFLSPAKRRFIAFSLIIIFFLPIMLLATSEVVLAADGSLFSENTSIFKGLIMIVMAFFLDSFLGNQKVGNNLDDPSLTPIPDNNSNPYYPQTRRYLSPGEKEVLGFYVNWNTPGVESYPSLTKNANNIDLVAPFWFTVTPEGNVVSKYDGPQQHVDKFVREEGQLILPLINNDKTSSKMITDPAIRKKAIENIVALVQRNNYDGVNIDFEMLPSWTKDSYSTFIRELSQKLHARGKMVTISVFPKVDVPYSIMGAYDYKALAPYIDRLVIMTYDRHWSTGSAGPIAPLAWVEENIISTLRDVPAEKILLGIANYGYDWSANGGQGKDIAAKKAIELAERKGAQIKWDSDAQVPYFNYTDSSRYKHTVYFESSYSLDTKLMLVNKYSLKGVAIWRLGNEEDRFWEILRNRLNK